MSETENEDLTPEEAAKLAPFLLGLFAVLRDLAFALMLAVCVVLALGGWRAWTWWIAIPIGAVAIFATRVFRRWAENVLTAAREEMNRIQGIEPETLDPAPSSTAAARPKLRMTGGAQLAITVAVMICASAFWYILGALARWLL